MKFVAGNGFKPGKNNYFIHGSLINKPYMKIRRPWRFFAKKVKMKHIKNIEVASEEAVQRLGGQVGWGIAGAALLGPAGLLVGLLRGGKDKNTTFVCELKNGKRFIAVAPADMWTEIQAATFK